jgi:hypothetical protein
VFLIPFTFIWGGFAIFWVVGTIFADVPWFFPLIGLPFVVVGVYVSIGRFWLDARRRATTFYAVTTDRVLILSGIRTRRIKSLSIDTLPDVTLAERPDGSGLITFGSAGLLD